MKLFLRITGLIALIPIAVFSVILACDMAISHSATPHIHNDLSTLPFNEACIVLGTTPYRKGSKEGNPYFNYRMDAAAELYKSGKTKRIIASGDSSYGYDETTKMRTALIKRGVPAHAIIRDTQGHGTIESMRRAQSKFGLTRFTVVSQQFQNERAIYIARNHGLEASGYNARDIEVKQGARVYFREKLARVKVVLEILSGK